MTTVRAVPALLLAVAASGCGSSSSRPPVYPVTGTVVVAGQPTPNVRVIFVAQSPAEGVPSEFEVITGEGGKFEASTYRTGDGLPPGRYAVTLIWPQFMTDDPVAGGDRLRWRYANRQKPFQVVEVKAESNQLPPFDVK